MSAILGKDGIYRYWLTRDIDPEPGRILIDTPVVWAMCNPSTADAEKDDATIRKCKGFTRRFGRSRMVVVNMFAFRSRHPKDLLTSYNPTGTENVLYVREAARIPGALIIAAWGSAVPRQLRHMAPIFAGLLSSGGSRVMCFGVTDDKQPRHPLMLSYSTPLEPYSL